MNSDAADIAAAARAAEEAMIGCGWKYDIATEPWLVWDPDAVGLGGMRWCHVDKPPMEMIHQARNSGGWTHVPDVLVSLKWTGADVREVHTRTPGIDIYVPHREFFLVVEVDGGIHDAKVSKTWKRNEDYQRAKIPYICVNKADAESRNVMWERALVPAVRSAIP